METTIKQDLNTILDSPQGKCLEKYIKKRYPQEYPIILSAPGKIWKEKLYNYIYHNNSVYKCPICDNPTKFISIKDGYLQYCSIKCAGKSKSRIEKIQNTCKSRYGVENVSQSKVIKKKKKDTLSSHYGSLDDAYSHIQQKMKETNLDRYGVKNVSQNERIKEKKRDTLSSHWGSLDDAYSHIQQKMKETNLDRYGVKNVSQNERIKEKIKQTNLERYGVENPMHSEEILKKHHKIIMSKYSSNSPFGSPDIQKKLHQDNINRIEDLIGYTDNGDWICRCPHLECNQCKEKYYIIPKEHQPGTFYNNRKRNNTEPCTRLLPIQSLSSTYELQVRSWLDNMNIHYISNDRSILNGLELDIYIPGNHLAIEINGCYWHSSACKSKSYHTEKWSRCKERGIKMIILWEDWIQVHPDSCKQLIMYHLGLTNTIDIPWDHNLVDLGLKDGLIKEHLSIHDGFECWDCGIFI